MLLSRLCICARLIGPKRVIFILLAVSVDDMAGTTEEPWAAFDDELRTKRPEAKA